MMPPGYKGRSIGSPKWRGTHILHTLYLLGFGGLDALVGFVGGYFLAFRAFDVGPVVFSVLQWLPAKEALNFLFHTPTIFRKSSGLISLVPYLRAFSALLLVLLGSLMIKKSRPLLTPLLASPPFEAISSARSWPS